VKEVRHGCKLLLGPFPRFLVTRWLLFAANVWVDADKMKMVRGGEPQDQAPHREERDEIPVFSSGAFKIHVRASLCCSSCWIARRGQ
jgi:hypothetical protein